MFTTQILFLYIGTKKFINCASLCLSPAAFSSDLLPNWQRATSNRERFSTTWPKRACFWLLTWQNRCLWKQVSFSAQVIHKMNIDSKCRQQMEDLLDFVHFSIWPTLGKYYFQSTGRQVKHNQPLPGDTDNSDRSCDLGEREDQLVVI